MRWKIHAIVIATITILLLGAYALFKPGQKDPVMGEAVSPVKMLIAEATWGRNCNALYPIYIRREQEMKRTDQKKTANAAVKSPPVMIQTNNVLEKIKTLCEGKPRCVVEARPATLGDIFTDCSKELEVSWRCFSYDRLQKQKTINGGTLKIECDPS